MQQGNPGPLTTTDTTKTVGLPAEAREEAGSEASGRENREREEHLTQMEAEEERLGGGEGAGGHLVFPLSVCVCVEGGHFPIAFPLSSQGGYHSGQERSLDGGVTTPTGVISC